MDDSEGIDAIVERLNQMRRAAFTMPTAIEASAHYGYGPVATARFPPDTPIGEVYRWAAVGHDNARSPAKPPRIVISAAVDITK